MATTIADVGTELVERAHALARDAARHGGEASDVLAHAAAELAERATEAGSELAGRAGDGARRVGELLPDHAPAVARPRRALVGLALGAVVVSVAVVAWRRSRRPAADAVPNFERPAEPGANATRASA